MQVTKKVYSYTYIPIYLYTYIPIYLYTYIPIYLLRGAGAVQFRRWYILRTAAAAKVQNRVCRHCREQGIQDR